MYLADRGHKVSGGDNSFRRLTVKRMGSQSATPIIRMKKRLENYESVSGHEIKFERGDYTEQAYAKNMIKKNMPDCIVHLGEIPSAPYCVTDDVEVLTNNGFKTVDEVNKQTDLIATANLKNEILEYQNPISINVFEYSGDMIQYKRGKTTLLCTPNHRCVTHQNNRATGEWYYIPTLAKNRGQVDAPTTFPAVDHSDISIKDEWFSLAGWLTSEGHFGTEGIGNHKTIFLYQSEYNNKNSREIERLLETLELKYYRYYDKKQHFNSYRISSKCRNRILTKIPEKYAVPEFVKNSSLRQKKIFVNSFIDGDGNRRPDGRICLYFGRHQKPFADEMQALLTEMGFPTIMHFDNSGYGKYVLYIVNTKHRRFKRKGRIKFKGRVWCPTTDNGTWICRKDGLVFVTGNSMIDLERCNYTMMNNITSTNNLLWAMKKFVPNCHLLKLGTLGELGTPNLDIPEGFFDVEYRGRKDRLPFPRQPGSFYHLSKVHDTHNIMFACKIWGLRSTDIMQGVVHGVKTPQMINKALLTRFDFDEVWGTALNRFCAQAVIGHELTPYGKGGQTRGYIALRDSMQCLTLALESPPERGEYRVFNQFDECYSVNELAEHVVKVGEEYGLNPKIWNIPNPRVEAEEHYYNPDREKLPALGFKPTNTLDDELRITIPTLMEFKDRIEAKKDKIMPTVTWR